MKWKSSSPDLVPTITNEADSALWVWTKENFTGSRVEDNTPAWHVPQPWIQISDCPDWETVSGEFAEAWKEEPSEPALNALVDEIRKEPGNLLQQMERAIQLVQDEYRHLSSGASVDGAPPTPLAVIIRRRFGDEKDLSFLLMHLLKRLGTDARLVLVNTTFGKSLGNLLPMTSLFDHVLVEFQMRGETRWIDATAKRQGGGALRRVLPDYGIGLPLMRAAGNLTALPAGSMPPDLYEIKESILLDTSGSTSLLGVVLTTRGLHAEELRRQFETEGAEAMARRRLQFCIDRFTEAERIAPMEYRDDREANEFLIAETFQIKNFLTPDVKSGWYKLEVTDDFLAGLLKFPESGTRRSPFALPYPCHAAHIFEVYCVALPPAVVQHRVIENPWIQFNRWRKTLAGFWTIKSTLSTLCDSVPAARIDEHRETLRELRAYSTWSLLVPAGQERPHPRGNFGKLPVAWEKQGGTALSVAMEEESEVEMPPFPEEPPETERNPAPAAAPQTETVAAPQTGASAPKIYKRRRRHRRKRRQNKIVVLKRAVLGLLLFAFIIFALVFIAKKGASALPKLRDPNGTTLDAR